MRQDDLPRQDELRLSRAEKRLAGLGYIVGKRLRAATKTRVIPSRLVNPCKRGTGGGSYIAVQWQDVLPWAVENFPRFQISEQTQIFQVGDEDPMRRHVGELHAIAKGEEGLLMLALHRDSGRAWEPSGVTYEPLWPGQIEETMVLIREAVAQDADPIILPALFRANSPSMALGVSVYTRRPDILLVVPLTPRSLIMHADDVFEATFLFADPVPMERKVRDFGRAFARITGGAVFP